MSAAERLAAFVARARQSPLAGSDPSELAALEQLTVELDCKGEDRWGALSAPIAPLTWEIRALLLGAQAQTARIQFPSPGPIEIVGAFAAIEAVAAVGIAPTLNSVDVLLEVDKNTWKTAAAGVSTSVANAPVDDQFVTLAALHAPRLMNLRLDWGQPQIAATFRWKRGTGVYFDSLISLALFVRPLTQGR